MRIAYPAYVEVSLERTRVAHQLGLAEWRERDEDAETLKTWEVSPAAVSPTLDSRATTAGWPSPE